MTGNFARRMAFACVLAAAGLFASAAEADLGPPGITRYISFVTRPANMSHADFITALLAQAMKAKTLSRPLGGLVISDVIPPSNGRPAQLDTDAMVEVWALDEADHAALLATPDGKKWAAGMDALYGKATTYTGREHLFTLPNKRGGTVKGVSLLVRKDGWNKPDFIAHWIGIHGVMATKVPGLVGFVLTELTKTETKGDIIMPEDDGIAELWWDSPPNAAPGASVPSDYATGWYHDGDIFIERGKSRGLSVKGTVIIPVSE